MVAEENQNSQEHGKYRNGFKHHGSQQAQVDGHRQRTEEPNIQREHLQHKEVSDLKGKGHFKSGKKFHKFENNFEKRDFGNRRGKGARKA